ncbi:MAG TPA: hypothetical protein PK089_09665 [Methanoregulaceae archaeon]|nr:hypothetical protein [Methanoregulaceae archaeon]HQJ88037.1 hypothetical protein [Methanoregulaceae archaeon]
MEKRSIGAIGAGILIVILIALVLRPPAPLLALVSPTPTPTPTLPTIPIPVPTTIPTPTVLPAPTGGAVETRAIGFSARPWEYPLFRIPANLEVYGASDQPWRFNDSIVFGYVNGTRGGVTERFFVPYPTWRLVSRTSSSSWPEHARLRLALVDGSSGQVITGMDLKYPGTAQRVIRISNREFYLILTPERLDRYTITLEAPIELVGVPG